MPPYGAPSAVVEYAGQKLPAEQGPLQVAAVLKARPYLPALHGRQAPADVVPPLLYVPAGHASGGVAATQKYPGGHAVAQLPVDPLPAIAVPAGQL
jgi:hypothetical protein